MVCVWYIGVVRAVSVLFYGVRWAKNVKDRTRRNGGEPVHVPSGCWVQDRGVARRFKNIIHHQFCQSHCRKQNLSICYRVNDRTYIDNQTDDNIVRSSLHWPSDDDDEEQVLTEGSGSGSTQSYDLICIVPRRSLLNTVIPGWLWRGITAFRGKKRITICQANARTSEKLKDSFFGEKSKFSLEP